MSRIIVITVGLVLLTALSIKVNNSISPDIKSLNLPGNFDIKRTGIYTKEFAV
jgi:hypothetical protein